MVLRVLDGAPRRVASTTGHDLWVACREFVCESHDVAHGTWCVEDIFENELAMRVWATAVWSFPNGENGGADPGNLHVLLSRVDAAGLGLEWRVFCEPAAAFACAGCIVSIVACV